MEYLGKANWIIACLWQNVKTLKNGGKTVSNPLLPTAILLPQTKVYIIQSWQTTIMSAQEKRRLVLFYKNWQIVSYDKKNCS